MMHKYHGTCEPTARSLRRKSFARSANPPPVLRVCVDLHLLQSLRVQVSCQRNSCLTLLSSFLHLIPPNRRTKNKPAHTHLQFGTVHLISKLPPSPLSHKGLPPPAALPRSATPHQPNAPTNSLPSHPDQISTLFAPIHSFISQPPAAACDTIHYTFTTPTAGRLTFAASRHLSSAFSDVRCAPLPCTLLIAAYRALLHRIASHQQHRQRVRPLLFSACRHSQTASLLPDVPRHWTLVSIRL